MLKESEINKIQKKIGYKFENKRLLSQAFVRKSYSRVNGEENNEILEFFGDRILDLAVIKDFYDLHGRFNNKNEFSSRKSVGDLAKEDCQLIKNVNLAEQISRLGLTKYLKVAKNSEKIAMKTKADLFEAILGAVALDSNWNLGVISAVFHGLMYSRSEIEEPSFNLEDYIDLFETELWKLDIFKIENKYEHFDNGVKCSFIIFLNGNPYKIVGFASTEHLAKVNAYEKGYKIIKLWVKREFIENLEFSEQLFFLHSMGFIEEPKMHYEFFPISSENPTEIWRCYGSFPSSENEYAFEDKSYFEAKEQVCYALLCEILGLEMNGLDFEDKDVTFSAEQEKSNKDFDGIIRGQGLLKLILSEYKVA